MQKSYTNSFKGLVSFQVRSVIKIQWLKIAVQMRIISILLLVSLSDIRDA